MVSDPASSWLVTYDGFDPATEGQREALCALGNGCFVTRGAAPEHGADGVHYPGTYVAGLYNRLGSEVSSRWVENESIVNAPNWLVLRFRVDGGSWFGDPGTDVLEHRLELDLHRGVLTRRSHLRDAEGHVLLVAQRRFVSMRDRHLAGLETTLVAEGWSGTLEVCSGLDGSVRNAGVARYRELPDGHLDQIERGRAGEDVTFLVVETNQSSIRIAEAARTRLTLDGVVLAGPEEVLDRDTSVEAHFMVTVAAGQVLIVEKVVALVSSHDPAVSEPGWTARDLVSHLGAGFETLLQRHVGAWGHLWHRMRLDLGTDGDVLRLLHLHSFHVLQTVSTHSVGQDVGVPARGLHGEAYRGHIFWDELFVFPFLSLRFPQITRQLLLYRYHRLDRARRAAAEDGFAGAMFPWQSGSDGREETQTTHLNPNSGRWLPDASHLQRHVNVAIALNTWQYYQATGDFEFLRFYGAEMMLEIARFWSSIATYDHVHDRYDIKGVMGPDEYHERYPDHDEPGVDNNAYTNLMATWCLCRAFDVLEVLPPVVGAELRERLGLGREELDHWGEVSRKLRVCFHDGIISQFEGFDRLEELEWDHYRATYGDIHRLDRILEAEGDSTNRYKLTKQADVMMLFWLLSPGELEDLLLRLGYDYDDELIARNVAYYGARTAHGSTLSRVVHAWVFARSDRDRSWKLFIEALHGDFDDIQRGTTAEGIHLGAMGGTIDLLQRCYSGLETRQDMLLLDPVIPEELGSLSFDIRYRDHLVSLDLTPERACVRVDAHEGEPITVEIAGGRHIVGPGHTVEVALGP